MLIKTVKYLAIIAIITFITCRLLFYHKAKSIPVQQSRPDVVIKKVDDIPLPLNGTYKRVQVMQGTFAEWLRKLRIRSDQQKVRLYNGKLKSNQQAHYAIIDVDIGRKDLQQCADAVIRLRAEYLFAIKEYAKIRFNYTNGFGSEYLKWREGYRPIVKNDSVSLLKLSDYDSTYQNFGTYLENIFMYAGSYSLSKELDRVSVDSLQIGNVFIEGGFPGHAVIVIDLAVQEQSGEKIILLAQSYMPAQDIHVLKNYREENISPWYKIKEHEKLYTPEWTFEWDQLYSFN